MTTDTIGDTEDREPETALISVEKNGQAISVVLSEAARRKLILALLDDDDFVQWGT